MTFRAVDVFVLWCTVIANTKSSLVVQNYLAIFFFYSPIAHYYLVYIIRWRAGMRKKG